MKTRLFAITCVAMVVIFAAAATSAQAQSLMSRWPGRAHGTAVADPSAPKQTPGIRTDADTCAYTFTNAGKGNSFMSFCVSTNGNIISLQSPSGIEYLALGTLSEGYGICDLDTGASYFDFADYGISSNWQAPVLVSSSAASVKIARTTSDGVYTLTQTLAKQPGTTPYVKVTNAIKNNTAATRVIFFIRWADVDPFNANATGNFQESFDSTNNSAWGYTAYDYSGPDTPGYGLAISNIGLPNVPYAFGGFDLNTNLAPNPCAPTANYFGYQALVDGSVEMLYELELLAKKTGTVNQKYEAF